MSELPEFTLQLSVVFRVIQQHVAHASSSRDCKAPSFHTQTSHIMDTRIPACRWKSEIHGRHSRTNKTNSGRGAVIDFQRHIKLCLFISVFYFLLTPSYLFGYTLYTGFYVTFKKKTKKAICFFYWSLHKSERFISRQHTSSKMPGRILPLYFYLIISWAHSGVRVTTTGSIKVSDHSAFSLFAHDTWLMCVLFGAFVE